MGVSSIFSFLRRNRFYILTSIFLGILSVAFFLVPGREKVLPESRITKLYFADNISEAHYDLIHRFNNDYAGKIEVIPIDLPFSKFSTNERKELLTRSLRSKSSLIDLFCVDIIWVPRFAKWGLPLDEYFTQAERDKLVDHVLASCTYDGKMVAYPLYTDLAHMYYRLDIIQSLPDGDEVQRQLEQSITWEEFIQLGRRMRNMGYDQPFFLYPADNFEGLTCSFFEGLGDERKHILGADTLDLTHKNAARSLKLLKDLVHVHGLSPETIYTFDEYQGYIYAMETDAVFFRGWPGLQQQHRISMPQGEKLDNVKMTLLPHFKGEHPRFVYGGWNFMISRFTSKREAAMTFIKYALKEENQKRFFQIGGFLPIIKSVYRDSVFSASHPMLANYERLLKFGIHRPYREDYTRISNVLSYYLHQAITSELPVKPALEKTESAILNNNAIFR